MKSKYYKKGSRHKAAKKNKSSFVYIIRCEGSNYYKIGTAYEPRQRLDELQTGCPYLLSIYSWVLYEKSFNSKGAESIVHSEFMVHRIRGEWFECDESLIEEVLRSLAMSGFAIESSKKIEGITEPPIPTLRDVLCRSCDGEKCGIYPCIHRRVGQLYTHYIKGRP